MKLKRLKNIFTTEEEITDEQNETAYAEIQFLDERSLTLVIREAKGQRSPSIEDIERTLCQW